MKHKRSSMDGFIVRQPGSGARMGGLHDHDPQKTTIDTPNDREMDTMGSPDSRLLGQSIQQRSLGRADLDESLRSIDESAPPEKKTSRKWRRKARRNKNAHPRRKIVKRVALILLALALIVAGYMAVRFLIAGGNIFQGNIFDVFQGKALKQDENGRSNFLILGTSDDDPNHPGGDLTDSMMVVSVHQEKQDVYMFSVPRDLYVEYGRACPEGMRGRINSYFSCQTAGDTTEEAVMKGASATRELVGKIFGLDIQYSVLVNHAVVKDTVDAVGGIEVEIEGSNGAPGILDRNFDWRCEYRCYLVRYDNGVHHLDGDSALYLSMARGENTGYPTYGLANSNFDREKNQQKILIAVKEKAVSTGVMTNLNAVTQLIDALGSNLRSNIEMGEIRTLIKLGNQIETDNIHTLDLFDKEDRVLTNSHHDGKSVVTPMAGVFDYTEIRSFIKRQISNDPVLQEAAPVAVFNGTDVPGLGQERADELSAKGYNVVMVGNAPAGSYKDVEIYQIDSGSKGTAQQLEGLLSASIIKNTLPPVVITGEVQFVVIFGSPAA